MMIKVSEVKAIMGEGFEFVNGDEITHQCGEVEIVNVDDAKTLNRTTAVDLLNACITEFAPRPNTGAQPVGDDVVVIYRDVHGSEFTCKAGGIAWGNAEAGSTWKPCMKWLMEQVEKEEGDEPSSVIFAPENRPDVKPTFTQADAGKLPEVGSEVIYSTSSEGNKVGTVTGYRTAMPLKPYGGTDIYRRVFVVMGTNERPIGDVYAIPTERDLAIDAALALDEYKVQSSSDTGMMSRRDFCGALFDAGLLKEVK